MLASATSATGSSWSTERASLVAEALRGAHTGRSTMQTLRMRVYGESMLPALWPGDIVEIAPCSPRDPRQGEIVLAFATAVFSYTVLSPRLTPADSFCAAIPCPLPTLVFRSSVCLADWFAGRPQSKAILGQIKLFAQAYRRAFHAPSESSCVTSPQPAAWR